MSLGITFLLLLVFGFLLYQQKFIPFIFKSILLFLFMQLGYLTFYAHHPKNQDNHYSHFLKDENSEISIEITDILKENPYFDQYFAAINWIDKKPVTGKILIKINRSDSLAKFDIGDLIVAQTSFKGIPKAKNPNQFEYADYLAKQGVFHETTLQNNTFIVVGNERGFFQKIASIRTKISRRFEETESNSQNIAVLKALLLGQKNDIDATLKNQYSDAGAVHILAISGLHVGIILFFLLWVLKPIKKLRFGKIMVLIISLTILWGFAFLAGLSASVVRAVTMFSFVAIGLQITNRGYNIYNTLAISAFLLLLLKPSFLFDVGFQLSYLAVLSIVTFQPYFSKTLRKPEHKIFGYLHDIITVSFAAQIGVLPLSLYYFHQFPGLFFLTNLVVIPLVTVILGLGIVALLIALFTHIPSWFVVVLDFFLQWMNTYIVWVAQFQNLIIRNIPMTILLVFTTYLVLLFWGFCVKKSYNRFAIPLLIMVVISQITYGLTQFHYLKEEKQLILHQYKNSVLLIQKNQRITVFSSNVDKLHLKTIQNIAQAHFSEIDTIQSLKSVYEIGNKKTLILDSLTIIPTNYKPDVLWLTASPKINLDRILEQMNVSQVVVDGSNKGYLIALWKSSCEAKKIPIHITYEQGFYEFE